MDLVSLGSTHYIVSLVVCYWYLDQKKTIEYTDNSWSLPIFVVYPYIRQIYTYYHLRNHILALIFMKFGTQAICLPIKIYLDNK